MSNGQRLNESMWDLVYGLLSEEEGQALIARIKSDPDVARLYAEVRLQADLVAQAAKVDDPSLVLSPATAANVSPKTSASTAPRTRRAKRGAQRFFNGLTALGATALAVLLGVGLLGTASTARPTALVVNVVGDAAMPAGLSRALTIKTYATNSRGEQKAAEQTNLELRLVSSQGGEILRQQVATTASGETTINIPGNALEPGVQLEVNTTQPSALDFSARQSASTSTGISSAARNLVRAALPVEPEPRLAYLLCAEPTVEAGKPVDVSLWNFSAFSNKPAPPSEVSAAAKEVPGLTVEQPNIAQQQQGLLNAKLNVDPQSSPEPIAAYSAANNQNRQFAGGPQNALQQVESLRRDVLAEGKADVADQAAAGLPAAQANDAPIAMRRAGSQASRLTERAQQRVAQAAPRQVAPSGAIGQPERSESNVVAETLPTIPSGQPVVVSLAPDLASKSLLATAVCRGVTVATSLHDPAATANAAAKKAQLPTTELQLDLPPEADGVVDVFVFDRSQGEAALVNQQSFYREPLRKLNIELTGEKPRFVPGERVQLGLRVTDEQGKPAPDALVGVRVWNEMVLAQSAEQPVLLEEALRGGIVEADAGPLAAKQEFQQKTQQTAQPNGFAYPATNNARASRNIQRSRGFEGAQLAQSPMPPADLQKQLSEADRAVPARSAAAAGGGMPPAPSATTRADRVSTDEAEQLAAPTDAVPAFSDLIVLASNQEQAQAAVAEAAQALQQSRQQRLTAIGSALLIGGILLLAAIGIGALRRSMPRVAIVVPSLAASLAGIVLGFMWIGSPPVASHRTLAEASRPSASSVSESGSQRVELERTDVGGTTASAAQEMRDARGLATASSGGMPAETVASPAAMPAAPAARSAPGGFGAIAGAAGGAAAAKDGAPIVPAASEPLATAPLASALMPSDAQAKENANQPKSDTLAVTPQQPAIGREAASAPAIAAAELANNNPLRSALGAAGRAPQLPRAATQEEAPAALYFNPQLATDAQGRANIEFVVPPVESEYRLLIDALGQGRVGSRQQQLIIGDRQGAK